VVMPQIVISLIADSISGTLIFLSEIAQEHVYSGLLARPKLIQPYSKAFVRRIHCTGAAFPKLRTPAEARQDRCAHRRRPHSAALNFVPALQEPRRRDRMTIHPCGPFARPID